ncbi:MAG: hypothetical protein ACLUBZ_17565, partial [Ruthenibacterium lactatiformans]|uniref:hypothetical protein n=1 Tax=Ruthenibacterium lactatiformans TaxID=1550024 RepID=UPI003994198E
VSFKRISWSQRLQAPALLCKSARRCAPGAFLPSYTIPNLQKFFLANLPFSAAAFRAAFFALFLRRRGQFRLKTALLRPSPRKNNLHKIKFQNAAFGRQT